MSFGLTVKEELCTIPLKDPCCVLAEAVAVLLYCSTFSATEIKVTTSSEHFAKRLPLLFSKAFDLDWDNTPNYKNKFTFILESPKKIHKILQILDYNPNSLTCHIPFHLLEEKHCVNSFCRGAFLTGGSVTNPEKHYHLELITSHLSISRELPVLLHETNFSPKTSQRKGHYINYFKQSKHISQFLREIGSTQSAEIVENSKYIKNITSEVNRQVNCDAANLNKAVDAAQSQIKAIRLLESQGLLTDLPDKLKETAHLRMENPHCTLTELAECFSPPLSKSALNHRLRKLVALTQNTENLPIKE